MGPKLPTKSYRQL